MPAVQEVALWLIFASISIGGVGLAALLIWQTLRTMLGSIALEAVR